MGKNGYLNTVLQRTMTDSSLQEIRATQVLDLLFKMQSLGLNPQIIPIEGDFEIYFMDVAGRTGLTESVTVTGNGDWRGYGWPFHGLMSALEKRIKEKELFGRKN